MTHHRLRFYSALSRLPIPRSYVGKIMSAAFVGIDIPLLALFAYFVTSRSEDLRAELPMIAVVLVATLLGTGLTLLAIRALLAPVSLASTALHDYLDGRGRPDLPTRHKDMAGRLMSDLQYAVTHLDDLVTELELLSSTDHPTHAYNRRAGEARLREDVERAARGGAGLWVVLFDVDDYKVINDRWGHPTGDECLQRVAEAVRGSIRRTDWLARWGGDEFLLVLWQTEVGSVLEVLERIEEQVRLSTVLSASGEEIGITLGMGIARQRPSAHAAALLVEADEALYRAKREGKARICLAPYAVPDTVPGPVR